MRTPIRPLAAATLSLFAAAALAQGKTEVLWLGQSAFRITTPTGKVIVLDPYLTANPKTPAHWKNLDALGKVDLILVTHAHNDHVADAPALALKNRAPIWNGAGLGQTLVALGLVPPELAPRFGKGGTIQPFGPGGVKVTATHAEHSSEYVHRNPATDRNEVHYGGEPVGYVIELEDGFRIYHSGDTGLFGDMRMIGERYRPNLALLPIGGHSTMDPKDAAEAARDYLKPQYAIPMHYGTNPTLRGTPQEFQQALAGAPVKVVVLDPGEKATFPVE